MTELEPTAEFALTTSEQTQLEALEATIAAGFTGFMETGAAFKAIRDSGKPSKRLYRATHDNFPSYCKDVWGLAETTVNQLIAASTVGEVLETTAIAVVLPRPKSESVARELAPLLNDKSKSESERAANVTDAWASVVEAHGATPTAKQVKAIVQPLVFRASMERQGYLDPEEIIEGVEVVDGPPARKELEAGPKAPTRSASTLASFTRAFNAALSDGWSLREISEVMDRVYRERQS